MQEVHQAISPFLFSFTLSKASKMANAIAFLDDFRKMRDFSSAFPQLLADEAFRNELFDQIRYNKYPYAEYASWIAQRFFETYPDLLAPWTAIFRDLILTTSNHTVQRNLVHLFAHIKTGMEEDGLFLDRLMGFIASADALPALKVNAFKAIEIQYIHAYPELIPELQLLIDLHREDTRPSIQSLVRSFHKRYAKRLQSFSA